MKIFSDEKIFTVDAGLNRRNDRYLNATYRQGNYLWTKDGVPCHRAKYVQKFCKANFADLWPVNFWPSSSQTWNN